MPEQSDPKPSIEDRLAELESGNRVLLKLIVEQHAVNMALISMVTELVERAGISQAEVHRHLLDRRALFQDSIFRKLEDENDSLAADLDTRPTFDFELPDGVRPLFPKRA